MAMSYLTKNVLLLRNIARQPYGLLSTSIHTTIARSESSQDDSDERQQQEGLDSSSSSTGQDHPLYPTHIPTNPIQKCLLAFGSSLMSIVDPWRHDMVAVCSETTALRPILDNLLQRMTENPEGNRIVEDRPIINTTTVDFNYLESLPENTFGFTYAKFMKDNKITPDSRDPVKFVDDIDHAYVIRRYREIHDIVHCLCGMRTHMLGEVAVKWVEALQTNLPMTWGGAVLGGLRLAPKQRRLYRSTYLPWALKCGHEARFFLSVYYEKRWNQDITDLRNELRIPPLIQER